MQPIVEGEKRQYTRFNVRSGVFAHLNSNAPTVGEVLNVSEGGLAFKYLNGLSSSPKHSTLNVFALGGKFFLRDIPVNKVSETEIPAEMDFASLSMKRIGLAFEDMTENQQKDLRKLILEKRAN